MRVTTVGSGDAFGSGGRFQTCIALAADEVDAPSVLLDCGATSLTALRQQQIDPNQIEAVLVTHLHGDHFGGLPFLVLDAQFRRRTHDLTVFGPPGTRTRFEQAMEILFPGSSSVQPPSPTWPGSAPPSRWSPTPARTCRSTSRA